MAREWVCMASGPSLTPEDVDQVRQWREAGGRRVIVTNRTYELAPWADILFAMDRRWWLQYRGEVEASGFAGQRYTKNPTILANDFRGDYGNSGAGAIELADARGADRIILLGYDGGGGHWHEPYPDDMDTIDNVSHKWPGQFERTAKRITADVVNASRHTVLTAFPSATLEDVL